MPSITQLEYLLAVERTGHFGRAADECGVAQPTLSAQIQKAEAELEVKLFDRAKKPVVPTPQGAQVLTEAKEIVRRHERLVWTAKGQASKVTGDFSLAIIPTLAPYVLPWFLPAFSNSHPEVKLSLFERSTRDILLGLKDETLDAGIAATPLGEAGLQENNLFYDPFYVYASPSHPVLEQEALAPTTLEEEEVWLLEDGHCVRNQVIEFCGSNSRQSHLRGVSFSAASFETLRHLIDVAGGYTLFPETYVRTLPRSVAQAQVRSFEEHTPVREVGLVHRADSWKTAIMQALQDSIRRGTPRALRQVAKDGDILPVR